MSNDEAVWRAIVSELRARKVSDRESSYKNLDVRRMQSSTEREQRYSLWAPEGTAAQSAIGGDTKSGRK